MNKEDLKKKTQAALQYCLEKKLITPAEARELLAQGQARLAARVLTMEEMHRRHQAQR